MHVRRMHGGLLRPVYMELMCQKRRSCFERVLKRRRRPFEALTFHHRIVTQLPTTSKRVLHDSGIISQKPRLLPYDGNVIFKR